MNTDNHNNHNEQVFICYAHEDETFARRLYHDLKQSGVPVWIDCEDILPGQRWKTTIKQAMKRSSFFLAILSEHSVSKTGYVQKELREALDWLEHMPPSKIFMIPVRIEDCEPEDERLHELQWVNCFPFEDRYADGLSKILRVLAPQQAGETALQEEFEIETGQVSENQAAQAAPKSSMQQSGRDYFERVGGNVYTGPVTIYQNSSPQPEEEKQQKTIGRRQEAECRPETPKQNHHDAGSSPEVPNLSLQEFSFETVEVNATGTIITREQCSARQYIEDLGDGVKLEMVYVPGGTFLMGAPESEQGSYDKERPQHKVTVSPFLLGKHPLTQEQWQSIMGKNPSTFRGATRPVENVSWDDAQEFCQRLSEKTGTDYRLPTEAEWEYACRAGTNTPFSFGETLTPELANYELKLRGTNEVGKYPPNPFGLYDMHGNVWEWCADWYAEYTEKAAENPTGPVSGSHRVLRGGGWLDGAGLCRAAFRNDWRPVDRDCYVGFRLLRTPS